MTTLPGGASRTAILTAVGRALQREAPPPWVLDDYLAEAMAGEEGIAIRNQLRHDLTEQALDVFVRWCCVRARYAEDVITEAAAAGRAVQYVLLGAGLDTFAYRRPDLVDTVRVFEVDHPSTQEWKRARLVAAAIPLPPNLVFAPVDFENQTLRDGLDSAGFAFARPAVFAWLGVTMYLTLDAIEATLQTVASSAPGTRLVLTYDLPFDAIPEVGRATRTAIQAIATEMGEPFISEFLPEEIEQLLRDHGYDDIRHVGPEEAVRLYFGGADVRVGGGQRLIAGTVA